MWLFSGSIFEAIRASVAVPGFLLPVVHDGVLLVDGGLVNPSARVLGPPEMGADILIAVDLGSDILGRRMRPDLPSEVPDGAIGGWMRRYRITLVSISIHSRVMCPRCRRSSMC